MMGLYHVVPDDELPQETEPEMPLSEQEQRLLDEMERNLYQNDADYVATVSARQGRPNYTLIVVGALIALAGVVLLIVGIRIPQPLVGLLGFIVMFGGVMFAIAPPRRFALATEERTEKKRARGFMDSLGDRWDQRSNGRS